MASERLLVEICIVLNRSGRYVVAASEEYANELAEGEFPDDFDRRYVKLGAHLFPPHEDVVSVATYQFDEPELVKDENQTE